MPQVHAVISSFRLDVHAERMVEDGKFAKNTANQPLKRTKKKKIIIQEQIGFDLMTKG